jgi:NAD+ synthase
MKSLKIASAQVSFTVGQSRNNAEKIYEVWKKLKDEVDLIVFPELSLTGYPPQDLLLADSYIQEKVDLVKKLESKITDGAGIIFGSPWKYKQDLYNAAILIDQGKIQSIVAKRELPNYSVFNESRYFTRGSLPYPIDFRGVKLGILICEDAWRPNVAASLLERGAEIFIAINMSPYDLTKARDRHIQIAQRARETNTPIIYVNSFGAEEELIFDGGSFAVQATGGFAYHLPFWQETVITQEWLNNGHIWSAKTSNPYVPNPRPEEQMYNAAITGLKYYLKNKGKFNGIVLGLSGGIDSALTTTIAADTVGARNVLAVMLTTRFTSRQSIEDARYTAKTLGIRYREIHLEQALAIINQTLGTVDFGSQVTNVAVTQENNQARLRGMLIMAISNSLNYLMLNTSNKSEIAVGYSTLYGDSCGGYGIISDIYKTQVYRLAKWRNTNTPTLSILKTKQEAQQIEPFNDSVLTKEASAELRENQLDRDSLPNYGLLDNILKKMIEDRMMPSEIIATGKYDRETVLQVARLVKNAEYKRRQMPTGVKVSSCSLGNKEWKMPI